MGQFHFDPPTYRELMARELVWLEAAGLAAEPVWLDRDLAVVRARRR